jgi:hypothetical protein
MSTTRSQPLSAHLEGLGRVPWFASSAAKWRPDVEAVFVVRLWYFNANLRVYPLDDHCTIIRVTKKEIAQIPCAERSPGALPPGALVAPSFGFQIAPGVLAVKAITSGNSYEDAKDRANHKFLSLIRSLHLLKPGSPYVGEGVAYQPHISGSRRECWGSEALPFGRGSFSSDYEFRKSEREVLRRIYRAVSVMPAKAELALRRFEMAHSRELDEDRLIDYWIALEALFLKREERQELSYRAALRMARFLGSSPDERVQIFHKVKRSYSVRSSVVHGDPPPADLTEITSFTGDQLRSALRQAVLAGDPPALDRLDAAIVAGGTYPPKERP